MKINLVLPHQLPFPPTRGGGVENLNWLLAREFARRGHKVVAYSRSIPDASPEETDAHGIQHVRVAGYDLVPNRWLDHLKALRYAWNLHSILRPADVTSFHTPFSFLLRRDPRLGVCTHTIHRTPKWQVFLYRHFDRVYCGSDAVVAQALKIDPRISNLKRIHNCIALDVEPCTPPPRNGQGLRFLYVGRFVPDKGLAALVKGFQLSLREFPENRLETVGPQTDKQGADSGFFEEMASYVQANSLTQQVTFQPPVFDRQKLDALIASADVICVPSLSGETFSMAILEAMAAGKPVLVSDFQPMTEAVDHTTTGYITRAGDPQSIAEGLRFFSKRPNEIAAIGRAGFEKARESFSVTKIADEYLHDFDRLIDLECRWQKGASRMQSTPANPRD